MVNAALYPAFPLEDYRHHQAEIDAAVQAVLRSGHYILGEQVAAFEQEFAAFIGVRHCIGLASGTDAVEIILRALDIGPGARVAVPSHTAVASVAAIIRAGATPVFCDIEPDTFTLCPDALEALLASPAGQGVKAVLAVHLYGHPVAWDRLLAICQARDLHLLEDCAQAHGASFQGRKTGALGVAAGFSFYPTKNLGALGDGGAITTHDEALAERIRQLREYGWKERYISHEHGVNSRLDEMQAAVLRVKLKALPSRLAARQVLATAYQQGLNGLHGLQLPVLRPGCEHAFHLYVVQSSWRDALCEQLPLRGIPVARHYPAAVHQQPAFAHITASSPALPVTEATIPRIVSLPLHPYLSLEAIARAAQAVREIHRSGLDL